MRQQRRRRSLGGAGLGGRNGLPHRFAQVVERFAGGCQATHRALDEAEGAPAAGAPDCCRGGARHVAGVLSSCVDEQPGTNARGMAGSPGHPPCTAAQPSGCSAASPHTFTCSFQSIPTLDRAPLPPVSMRALRVCAAGRLALRQGTSALHTARATLWAGKEETADQAGGPGCVWAGCWA